VVLTRSLSLPRADGNGVASQPLTFEILEDSANLSDPDIIAVEIVEDLQAALAQFAEIAIDLKRPSL